MHLHPMTQQLFEQTQVLFQIHQMPSPPPPERSMQVVTDQGVLAAFVGLYEARPFLLSEWLVVNPELSLSQRHHASGVLIEAVIAYAAANGLVPLAVPRSPGLKAMMKRYGFSDTHHTAMTMQVPTVPVGESSRALRARSRAVERVRQHNEQAMKTPPPDDDPKTPDPDEASDGGNQRSKAQGTKRAKKGKKKPSARRKR